MNKRWMQLSLVFAMLGALIYSGSVLQAAPHQQTDVLPAPLYFIDEGGLISRLETDGVTQTQVILDTEIVSYFDISPPDGRIIYVVANNLVVAEADGSNPTVIFAGGDMEYDEGGYPSLNSILRNQVTRPVWSADGMQVAFAYGGIHIFNFETGTQSLLFANEEPAEESPDGIPYGAKIYYPEAWSPDGSALILHFSWIPEGGGWAYYPLVSGEVSEILLPEGYNLCCGNNSWSADESMLYHGSANALYPGEAGLWTIDVPSLTMTEIATNYVSLDTESIVAEFAYPQILDDGKLYFFHQVLDYTSTDFNNITGLLPYRSNLDGSEFEALRLDDPLLGYNLGEGLWANDASGIVVNAFGLAEEDTQGVAPNYVFPMYWLTMSDGDPVFLAYGKNLRWGQ